MKINLLCSNISFGEESTPPEVQDDTITYGGLTYNFSPLPEGSEIDIGSPFTAPVKRVNGDIEASLHYFYKTETAETVQSSNPEDYVFNIISGQCPCPIKRKPAPDAPMEVVDE
jgi:hypothetical protein